MKLGFIILAHNQPDAVRRQVDVLAGAGHSVVVHFDTSAPKAQQDAVRSLESSYPGLVRVVSKVHCVWGEWSLVEAVLVGLREFAAMPDKPDYIHLMSGADFPIRPIADFEEFLRRNVGMDFIECCDITQRRWVKGGLSMERFRFFFPVNFRTSRKTFDRLVRWHRKLHIRRKIPLGMTPHMGSQWWTLRWSTCDAVLSFLRKNPGVVRYFRHTWIPDEAFFQTVIAHLVPRREIADLQLMLHHLTPTGRPYVVYEDHLPLVRKLPHFFIRKVSPAILDRLWDMARSRQSPIPKPSHLARVRDLMRSVIDGNYQHESIVPGHTHGSAPRHEAGPAVVFLTANSAETALVRAHAMVHPAVLWCGRPFRTDRIDLSDPLLAATGLTRTMTQVRENFPEQFADTLMAALPQDKVSVIVIESGDTALTSGMLSHWRTAHYVSLSSHAYCPALAPDRIERIPAHRIMRMLESRAPGGQAATTPSWLEVHHFGRIGNYFHLDATTSVDEAAISFILPGIEYEVRSESLHVAPQPGGRKHILLFFWVDDGAYLEVTKQHPVHVLLDSTSSLPHTIQELGESNAEDMLRMLDSFGVPAIWTDRLLLETFRHTSISDRCHFIRRAKDHWPADSADACLAMVMGDESLSFPGPDSSGQMVHDMEPVWEQMIDDLSRESAKDPANAWVNALSFIRTADLPRREILRAVHLCLPRDSKWWLLALSANPTLGDEQVADALNTIGSSSLQQGHVGLAELCFTAATLIHPASQSPAWNLGMLLASQGRAGEAAHAFRSVRRHYANESVSTLWPAIHQTAWPAAPWPTDAYTLPDGIPEWPRISIITPSYNQGHFIGETILSVLHQNYPNLQYIVVDGNSTDGTRDVLERYRDRIDHLVIEPDDGQTQAINKGFRLADGEIIAWLNSDDMYAPGALHQAALRWLASGADVLAGICAEHRDHGFAVINKPSASNRDFNTAQLARIFPYWFSGMYFFQPEVFFTKALVERVGLLDESLHYAMDYDLWMRFAKAGARLEVIDWPFAFFRLHNAQKTTQSSACIAEQCAVRNRHHPLALREERKHQLDRQFATLLSRKTPTIALLATEAADPRGLADDASATGIRFVGATDAADSNITIADAVLVPIGSSRGQMQLLKEIRAAHPDLLLIGWFADPGHDPHANHDAACLVDVVLAADPTIAEYLHTDSTIMGPAMPALTCAAIKDFLHGLFADRCV